MGSRSHTTLGSVSGVLNTFRVQKSSTLTPLRTERGKGRGGSTEIRAPTSKHVGHPSFGIVESVALPPACMTHRWRLHTCLPRVEKRSCSACIHAWYVVVALGFMSYLLMGEGGCGRGLFAKAGLGLVVPMWPWSGSGGHEAQELIHSNVFVMRPRGGTPPTPTLPHPT